MTQRQLHHFSNLCHLFIATTNIVISWTVKLFLRLSLDWFTFIEDKCLVGDGTVLTWLNSNDLELNWFIHSSFHLEAITFSDRTESILKVRNDKSLSDVAGDTFNCVSEGKNLDSCSVWQLSECTDVNNITDTNAEIVTGASVHANLAINSA